MNGTIAVLFLIAGLTDMALTDCKTDGCLARSDTAAQTSFGLGNVIYQQNVIGEEAYLRYDLDRNYGPFQPSVGLSVTNSGDAWVGLGAVYNVPTGVDGFYTQLSLLPGLYAQGNGPDLGHVLEIRSGIEFGYQANNGLRVGLSFDHRSNGELSSTNPGLETLQLRVTMPISKR